MLLRPLGGAVFVPFRKLQSRYVKSDVPAVYTPIQSLMLPGPFAIVMDTVAPAATVTVPGGEVPFTAMDCAAAARDKATKDTATNSVRRVIFVPSRLSPSTETMRCDGRTNDAKLCVGVGGS